MDKEIENSKYGSKELKKAKKKAEEKVLAFVYLYGANIERGLARRLHTWKTSMSAPLMIAKIVRSKALPKRLSNF